MPDSDSYRELASKLSAEKKQWYTYEDKKQRPIKVMARGLQPTCERQDIMMDLQQKGLKIIDAVKEVSSKKEKKEDQEGNRVISRKGLPLIMLTHKEKAECVHNYDQFLT